LYPTDSAAGQRKKGPGQSAEIALPSLVEDLKTFIHFLFPIHISSAVILHERGDGIIT
jgi:hypothetical protein